MSFSCSVLYIIHFTRSLEAHVLRSHFQEIFHILSYFIRRIKLDSKNGSYPKIRHIELRDTGVPYLNVNTIHYFKWLMIATNFSQFCETVYHLGTWLSLQRKFPFCFNALIFVGKDWRKIRIAYFCLFFILSYLEFDWKINYLIDY